ncbi:neuropeptide Y receptor type 2-like [Oculina patagonica]
MNATTNNSVIQNSNNETDPFIAEPSGSFFVRVCLFAVIMLASVLGNAVVCRSILLLPTRKRLFSYYLVTNLAAAEIISSLCFPFYFIYDWFNHWSFGEVACKLVFPIQMTAMFVVTYTLAFIAAYRYRVIMNKCHQLMTFSQAKVVLVFGLLWVAALIMVFPVGAMHTVIRTPYGDHCIPLLPGDTDIDAPRHTKYSIARFIMSFIIPYLVIVISYIAVAIRLKNHISNTTRTNDVTGTEKPLRQNGHPECMALQETGRDACMQNDNGNDISTRHPQNGSSVTELELEILRMIYVIILIFIVCYIPIQVVFLYEQLRGGTSYWPYYIIFRRYAFLLTCLPGAFHPILYGTMSKFYANAFAKLVLCDCRRCDK